MWRRILLLALVFLLTAAAVWWWHSRAAVAPWRAALSTRAIATRVLAEHLAKRYPRAKALVVGNPFTLRPEQGAEIYAFEKASIHGLEDGFGSSVAFKVVYPALRPESWERPQELLVQPTTTPLSFLVRPDAFDTLVQANSGYELVVSLIGLPLNISQSAIWRDAAGPRFALLLPDWRVLGGPDVIREAVRSEKIVAAVVKRPGDDEDEAKPLRGYQQEFNRRFLLVTKENIDELLRAFPQSF